MSCQAGLHVSEEERLPSATVKQASSQAFWDYVQKSPYRFDLFQMLRGLDATHSSGEPLGKARHPRMEPVRVRQEPSLAFAPATVAHAKQPQGDQPGEVSIYSFGLFGPNGPLPLHITEYVHERVKHHKDRSFSAFADLFHQRLILLFYRAWADAQPVVDMERGQDRFTRYVASLAHLGEPSVRPRSEVPEHAALYMAPHFARQMRSPDGLAQMLTFYFGVQVTLQSYVPQWMSLDEDECLMLGHSGTLGSASVLGQRVYDVQHKFRLHVGPLSWKQYKEFMPGNRLARILADWVKLYVGIEYAWDVRLILKSEEVQGVSLGAPTGPLGQASWLGLRSTAQEDAADFIKDYSMLEGKHG